MSTSTDEPEALPNLARAISGGPDQLCILHDRGNVWCSDGETQRHVDLGAVQLAAIGDAREGHGALTCALTRDGRVACWDRQWTYSVIPDVYEAIELDSRLGGICATTRRGNVACFDGRRIPRWFDDDVQSQALGIKFETIDHELASPCILSEDRRVLCRSAFDDDHPTTIELRPDDSLVPMSPEQLGLSFDADPWDRCAYLRRSDFADRVATFDAAARHELALRLLEPHSFQCLASEDTNSLYEWPTPSDAAGIYDGCWRRELFGWALTQVGAVELHERFNELCESIEDFDYLRWQALAEHAERLQPDARLRLAERLLAYPQLADFVVATLEHEQLAEAFALGLDAAVEWMSLPDHAVELRAAALEGRLDHEYRLAALENFEDPLDRQLMLELADDGDCAVAMRAAIVLADAGIVDRRPRLDRKLSIDEFAEALCRSSWDAEHASRQYAVWLRGQTVPQFERRAENDDAPRPAGDFTADDALVDIDRFECTTEDASTVCRFWPVQKYDVDSGAPEFDLAASSEWSYYELRFEQSKRGVRLLEVYEVRGTDCTNC